MSAPEHPTRAASSAHSHAERINDSLHLLHAERQHLKLDQETEPGAPGPGRAPKPKLRSHPRAQRTVWAGRERAHPECNLQCAVERGLQTAVDGSLAHAQRFRALPEPRRPGARVAAVRTAMTFRLTWMLTVTFCACGPGGLPPGNGHLGSGGTGGGGPIDPNGADAGTWEGDPVSCSHAAQTHTYVGCDFWPTVLPNVVKSYFDFAVVVANAGSNPAHITIERGGAPVAAGDVGPNAAEKFFLPWVADLKHFTALCDTDPTQQVGPLDQSKRVPGGAYHLVSSEPVTVFQFNPLEYKGQGGPPGKSWAGCSSCWPGCNSYTNDASLLLPSTALTGSYVVPAQSGIATSEINAPGYIAVTGLQNATSISVKVGARGAVQAGGGIASTSAGGITTFPIDRGEVVLLVGTPETDLGGTLLKADHPVQVMTGMPHTYLPFDRQSSDHIEEVVLPVETLGKHYFVVRPTGPNGNVVPQMVRFFGTTDGTNLAYPAGTPAGAPAHLGAGEVADLGLVDLDFEVTADQGFEIATYMLGQTIVDPSLAGRGDPSQSTVASVEQYRKKYVFLAPDDYDFSYADVVVPTGASLTLDGAPVPAMRMPLSAGLAVTRVMLGAGNQGAHVLESDQEFGLQIMGYGFATSYQYPGGLNLRGIAPPLPDIY